MHSICTAYVLYLLEAMDDFLALGEMSDKYFECVCSKGGMATHGQEDEYSQQLTVLLRVQVHLHRPTVCVCGGGGGRIRKNLE